MVTIVSATTAIILDVRSSQNQSAERSDNSLSQFSKSVMTKQSSKAEQDETSASQDDGHGVLVFATSDGECDQARWQDKYQHNQVKVFFSEQTTLHNWEQGYQQGQRQAMHHAGST